MSIATLAFITLAVVVGRGSTLLVLALTTVAGTGLGMVMPPTQVTVQLAAGPASLGAATASISLSRAIGGAAGVALVGAVLIAALGVAGGSLPALLARVLEAGPDAVAQMSDAERATMGARFDHAYRIAFGLLAGVTLLGALLARTIPRPDWYFLFLFQFLKLGNEFVMSIVIPGAVVTALLVWPFIDNIGGRIAARRLGWASWPVPGRNKITGTGWIVFLGILLFLTFWSLSGVTLPWFTGPVSGG